MGVHVHQNPVLDDVSGLTNTSASVANITENPSLPSCEASAAIVDISNLGDCRYNQVDACSDQPGDVCYW